MLILSNRRYDGERFVMNNRDYQHNDSTTLIAITRGISHFSITQNTCSNFPQLSRPPPTSASSQPRCWRGGLKTGSVVARSNPNLVSQYNLCPLLQCNQWYNTRLYHLPRLSMARSDAVTLPLENPLFFSTISSCTSNRKKQCSDSNDFSGPRHGIPQLSCWGYWVEWVTSWYLFWAEDNGSGCCYDWFCKHCVPQGHRPRILACRRKASYRQLKRVKAGWRQDQHVGTLGVVSECAELVDVICMPSLCKTHGSNIGPWIVLEARTVNLAWSFVLVF